MSRDVLSLSLTSIQHFPCLPQSAHSPRYLDGQFWRKAVVACDMLSPVWSLSQLGHLGGMTADSAEILFQCFLQEATVSSSGMGRDVHCLMSVQRFCCQPWCCPQRKRWEDNIREWTGREFGKSQRAVENREK